MHSWPARPHPRMNDRMHTRAHARKHAPTKARHDVMRRDASLHAAPRRGATRRVGATRHETT
eukprot:5344502-Alexandrium_andersonii.AAC.1